MAGAAVEAFSQSVSRKDNDNNRELNNLASSCYCCCCYCVVGVMPDELLVCLPAGRTHSSVNRSISRLSDNNNIKDNVMTTTKCPMGV